MKLQVERTGRTGSAHA